MKTTISILMPVLLAFTAQANEFAFKLYDQLKETEGNLFFSPASIEAALAMTAEGARGNTQEQFDALGVINFQTLENSGGIFPDIGKSVTFEMANAIWVDQLFPILGSYQSAVTEKYGAEIRAADFAGQPDAERETVNRWVEAKTRDKIKDLLPPGTVTPSTEMILVNAIYFKGDWKNAFNPKDTQAAPFRVSPEQPVSVSMMELRETRFKYGENEFFQSLELPYEGEEVSMLLLLPKDDALLNGISEEQFPAMRQTDVHAFLPKFKIESTFSNLKSTLAALGLTDAFDPARADFSGISERPLFISDVVHKAFVEVNEEGTEAAAATGVIMRVTSIGPPPKTFRADRPFTFLIRHNPSGKILFMGRVCDPSK
jgi:serpin B